MKLKRARMRFAIETEMVSNFKFNFMNDKDNEKSNWACDYCMKTYKQYKPDSMQHALVCDEYIDLRSRYNLCLENDKVDYFIEIVEKRNQLKHVQ